MPVEAEVYNWQSEETIDSSTIEKGKSKPMELFLGTRIPTFCNRQDKEGLSLVNTDKPEKLHAILYDEAIENDEGIELDLGGEITFSGSKYVLIFHENRPEEFYAQHFEDTDKPPSRPSPKRRKLPVPV